MIDIEKPNVSMRKTNEANMLEMKNWANNVSDQLAYTLGAIQDALSKMESEIEALKGVTEK